MPSRLLTGSIPDILQLVLLKNPLVVSILDIFTTETRKEKILGISLIKFTYYLENFKISNKKENVVMTATDIASEKLQTLVVSLSNSCALFTYFGIPTKNGLSQNLMKKGNLELDALDNKKDFRQFLVSGDGGVPFILATKLPYSKRAISTVLNHAAVSDENDPHCRKCPVSRSSESCIGKKVIKLRNGL